MADAISQLSEYHLVPHSITIAWQGIFLTLHPLKKYMWRLLMELCGVWLRQSTLSVHVCVMGLELNNRNVWESST